MFCLRRLPHLSLQEFQDYWLNQHGPLVRSVAPVLNIRRYVQSHTLSDPRLGGVSAVRGTLVEPYDGVAELWFDDIEAILASSATEAGRAAGTMLLEDERRFIDLPNSPLYFVQEQVVVDH
ncbi:EthD domain-containing protein [Novosphingobium sp.]|uniref:EthD domain-containing protein n=1 Tax=Novosphingobium sp. TaxID=1874826 RepID=UPI0035AF0F2B